jgi:hypothetical protein
MSAGLTASSSKKKLNFSPSSTSVSRNNHLSIDLKQVSEWSIETTLKWLKAIGYEACSANFLEHRINGRALLMLNEDDLREIIKYNVGHRKNLFHLIRTVQLKHAKYVNKSESKKFFNDSTDEEDDEENESEANFSNDDVMQSSNNELTATDPENANTDNQSDNSMLLNLKKTKSVRSKKPVNLDQNHNQESTQHSHGNQLLDESSPPLATPTKNICLNCLKKIDTSPYTNFEPTPYGFVPVRSYKGEKRKTLVAVFYLFFTCLWTSFMLTVVHDRVPDMEKYPPLPDIILDNVPLIPWAFFATEVIGIVLLLTMFLILILHKYRLIIFRRMCSLGGTIFILRSITMLITSLSVPGVHIQCSSQVRNFLLLNLKI